MRNSDASEYSSTTDARVLRSVAYYNVHQESSEQYAPQATVHCAAMMRDMSSLWVTLCTAAKPQLQPTGSNTSESL